MLMEQARGNEQNVIIRILYFYLDGFRKMTLGRTLWKVIIIKLIIMFGVLKLFFFPDFLDSNFTSDRQKADYVFKQITVHTDKQTRQNRR
jgi:hypothetical protein